MEGEATSRVIAIASQTNSPLYIVNVMSKTSANIIANARQRGRIYDVFARNTLMYH